MIQLKNVAIYTYFPYRPKAFIIESIMFLKLSGKKLKDMASTRELSRTFFTFSRLVKRPTKLGKKILKIIEINTNVMRDTKYPILW
jgi:hypothetical protein